MDKELQRVSQSLARHGIEHHVNADERKIYLSIPVDNVDTRRSKRYDYVTIRGKEFRIPPGITIRATGIHGVNKPKPKKES